jgi:nicotinate-nucleotide adenylyltransferase
LFKNRLERVALFGGSFDPPHFGHKLVVQKALNSLDIDKLIVVPTFLNPFKTGSHYTPNKRFLLSVEMLNSFKSVSVERFEIDQGEPTPTAKTVKHFQKEYSVDYIIIGADNLNSIHKWYNFKWLNEQVIWVVASRKGYKITSDRLRDFIILEVDADISSTQIRNQKNRE